MVKLDLWKWIGKIKAELGAAIAWPPSYLCKMAVYQKPSLHFHRAQLTLENWCPLNQHISYPLLHQVESEKFLTKEMWTVKFRVFKIFSSTVCWLVIKDYQAIRNGKSIRWRNLILCRGKLSNNTHIGLLYWKWKSLSHAWLFATSWTVACQAPLSIEFSRQE